MLKKPNQERRRVPICCSLVAIVYFRSANKRAEDQPLRRKHSIQKLISAVLLLLFVISITPKNYLHDLIARHSDDVVCKNTVGRTTCLHQQGYNCNFNNLVVAAPYLFQLDESPAAASVPFAVFRATKYTSHLQHFLLHKESRGPPAA
jgi:hypothetical protein